MAKLKAEKPVKDETDELLAKGVEDALTAAKKNGSNKNLKALTEAKSMLKEYRASKAAPGELPFKTIGDVLEYLQTEGWKVEKSKLYNDKNRIAKERDGSFSKKAVDEYAVTYLERRDGSDNDISDVARRKALAETESAEHDAARKKRIEDCANGKLYLRSEVKQKHTANLAQLITAVENLVYGGPMEAAIEMVGGDMKKLPPMQDQLMERFKTMLAEYSKSPTFVIPKKSMLEAEEFIKDAE